MSAPLSSTPSLQHNVLSALEVLLHDLHAHLPFCLVWEIGIQIVMVPSDHHHLRTARVMEARSVFFCLAIHGSHHMQV